MAAKYAAKKVAPKVIARIRRLFSPPATLAVDIIRFNFAELIAAAPERQYLCDPEKRNECNSRSRKY